MGLNNFEGSKTTYLNVADGKLIRRHQQANDKTVERITKTGKQVFEESFKDLKAMLVDVTTNENDFGKQWHLKVSEEGEETFIVALPYSSRYASSFLKALPNVNLEQPVRFMPWSMIDRNDASRKITGVTMYQEGGKIAPAFTKEEPNGLPEMEQIKVKGKMTWCDEKMMEFLEQNFINF